MSADRYRFTGVAPRTFSDPELQRLHDELRRTDEAWQGARAHALPYDLVRGLVLEHVEANHAYQRARWGRVRVRLTAAALMR